MKLTPDDYRRHYRELSDEEFLAIDRDDLVDVARRCYDAELAHRQLEPPEPAEADEPAEPEAAPMSEPSSGEDWALAAAFARVDEANAARSVLQSATIPAYLDNEHTARINWNIGGVRLMVPASEVESARELLQPYITEGNKNLVERWFQNVWMNGQDDPAAADAHLDEIRAALPGFTLAIEDLLSDHDRVAARISIHGKHAATGKPVEFGGICIVRLDAGAIAESWIHLDRHSLFEQTR